MNYILVGCPWSWFMPNITSNRATTYTNCVHVAVNFFLSLSVNCCFCFVSNLLAYVTIPQNNGKINIDWDKKKSTTYVKLHKIKSKLIRQLRDISLNFLEDGDFLFYCLLPKMAYTGRLRTKEVSLSGFGYVKG